MDVKLKVAVMAVLVSVVVCLAAVLGLLWTMPDRPMAHDHICLPNKAGHLKCGFAADRLHGYLERTITKSYDEIGTQEQSRLREICKQAQNGCRNLKPAAKLTGKKQSGTFNTDDLVADMFTITEWRHGRELYGTGGFGVHLI